MPYAPSGSNRNEDRWIEHLIHNDDSAINNNINLCRHEIAEILTTLLYLTVAPLNETVIILKCKPDILLRFMWL
jgi:hypothetical protein